MWRLIHRTLVTFIYHSLGIVPAASLLGGWPVWKAAITAGIAAAIELVVTEARKYLAATATEDQSEAVHL
jgi:hypothetical protein